MDHETLLERIIVGCKVVKLAPSAALLENKPVHFSTNSTSASKFCPSSLCYN